MNVYKGDFTCWGDVQKQFNTAETEDQKVVLFAAYDLWDYEGVATVLWFDLHGFNLVEASHCSCYGLEGQFEPEVMPLAALLRMSKAGKFGSDVHEILRDLARESK